nr:MAG TPA: hypothetical protein [Caudoviricetes sp.]
MSKKKYKKKRLESNTVLVAIDKSERTYDSSTDDLTGVYLKQPKSTDKIVEFGSIEELNKLYKGKGECGEEE